MSALASDQQRSVRGALIAWSALAEPGDVRAGALVDILGPVEALDWLRDGVDDLTGAAARLHGRCSREQAVDFVKHHEQWAARLEYLDRPLEARARSVGARVIVRGEPEWPLELDDLGTRAPFAMWVRGAGNLANLWGRAIALVGARAATAYGEHVTAEIAADLAHNRWTVLSGGAYGIDGAAHRAALGSQGPTIAVMAGGVDRLYPAGHDELLREVMESGCVVSEVPPGFAPHRHRFLARNRLIATAAVTVVVEAAWRSGALSTANHASEMLRPVGAVPGAVTSAASSGCHRLIREGQAVLVTSADDVLELAGPLKGEATSEESRTGIEFDSPEDRAVYDALSARPRQVEQIAQTAGLRHEQARASLAVLELTGLAGRDHAGWRKKPQKP